MKKTLLGLVIGLGIAVSGVVLAAHSGYFGTHSVWDNSYISTVNSNANKQATASADSFVDGPNTCYVLNSVGYGNNGAVYAPVGISCVKN